MEWIAGGNYVEVGGADNVGGGSAALGDEDGNDCWEDKGEEETEEPWGRTLHCGHHRLGETAQLLTPVRAFLRRSSIEVVEVLGWRF